MVYNIREFGVKRRRKKKKKRKTFYFGGLTGNKSHFLFFSVGFCDYALILFIKLEEKKKISFAT